MSKVFICYRHSDTGYQPELIKEKLTKILGKEIVFYDHDIEPAVNWKETLNEKIEMSEIMLVLIGKEWLIDNNERKRLFDPKDEVRYEIEFALEKVNSEKGYSIYPLLFEGAKMPGEDEVPESIKLLTKMQATEIEQNEVDQQLSMLGKKICIQLHGKSKCFIRTFQWYFISGLIMFIVAYALYCYILIKPSCKTFANNGHIGILLAPEKSGDYKDIEDRLLAGMDPFEPTVLPMEGNYSNLSQGELKNLAQSCYPKVLIVGEPQKCKFYTFDTELDSFIKENYNINPALFSKINVGPDKLACIINTFLSEKNKNSNVLSNAVCVRNQFNLFKGADPKDTLDLMIGQSLAKIYDNMGMSDSAMIIYEKLSVSGGVNPDSIYTRMSRIASKTKNTSAEIIAKTGLFKQAKKSGEKNKVDKLEKEIAVLNSKLNKEQAELNPNLITQNKTEVILQNSTNKTNTKKDTLPAKPNGNTNSSSAVNTNVNANNLKFYANLNRLIGKGNYKEIQRVYEKNKFKVDNNLVLLSLYYESMYKAKLISEDKIPANILTINPRLKTAVVTAKIKKE